MMATSIDHSGDPRAAYEERLEQRRATLAQRRRRDSAVSNWRLAIFLSAVALGVCVFALDWLNPTWLTVPLLAFGVLVVIHDRVVRQRDLAADAVAYYERALGRLDHTWFGAGNQTADFVADDHPYAADLDLFGEGSLFELLCQARTRAGEERLASWLAGPSPFDQVRLRQAAVEDLRLRLDLREDLALLGGGVRSEVSPEILAAWGTAAPVFTPGSARVMRVAAWALGLATPAALLAWAIATFVPAANFEFPIVPFLGLVLVEWLVYKLYNKQVQQVMLATDRPERDLRVLAVVLARLESESFEAPLLQDLQQALRVEGLTAAASIERLARLVMWLDSQRNAFFAPLGLLTMWAFHFTLRIEDWRRQAGARIPRWLDAVSELEALCSLAGYAYEHPRDPFPELEDEGPLLVAEELGHPLLKDDDCVRNSIALGDGAVRVLMVSGSNMSGKTTLMRFVGVNAVLAQAGAPVRAARLRLSPLSIGATIRIQDSLLAGRSRFYEEIKRLKQLMSMAEQDRPLLFLMDEVLHGTNSHDRRIGAAALLRQFLDAGALGIVTTHDLALAEKEAGLEQIRNMHFVDHVVDGELVFDYQLQEGVVQRSNAIELMRAVGLDV